MTLGQLILLLLMGTITVGNYLRYRDVLYPPVIQAGLWTVVLLLYVLNQERFYALSPLFYGLILAGLILFSLGSYLATRGHRFTASPLPPLGFAAKPWYASFLFWVPVVGLIPFFLIAHSLGQEGPFNSLYRNIRLSVVTAEDPSGGGAFGLAAYLVPISYVSVMLQTLFGHYRNDRIKYWISVLTALVYSLLFTGRISFLFLMVVIGGILIITRRVSPLRTALLVLLVGMTMFLGLGLLLEKEGLGTTLQETLQNLGDLLLSYALASLPAFDVFMQTHIDWGWGEHSFRTLYAVLSKLGFDVAVRSNHFEFTAVPFPTNVYTLYRPYFADFSIWGAGLIPLVLGYLHGFFYKRATEGHLIFIVAYAISLFPLLLQFYQDRYFSMLSFWIQLALLLFVYFYRLRFVPAA